ncbi:MAG: ribosomal-protein-alanine N-acetyltransferase [Maribacter sp.]|jgi:ribosomal-protein-alanine N-acetyltransferase
MTFIIYDAYLGIPSDEKKKVANFLHEHLEQYGDELKDIIKAMNFALKETPSFGGFILVAKKDKKIVGATVVNRTGMSGYIPENILVYIAIHKNYRSLGIGKKVMQKAMEFAKGDIALHVEPDNPAKFLYEKLGFESKYLEMRLARKHE